MQANITTCPFCKTEQLSDMAEQNTQDVQAALQELLACVKGTGLTSIANQIDDACMEMVNKVQNSTIRGIVCRNCDQDQSCHPVTA